MYDVATSMEKPVTNESYLVRWASSMVTVASDGGEAFSGVTPVAESKESGVALRDLVPVLDA